MTDQQAAQTDTGALIARRHADKWRKRAQKHHRADGRRSDYEQDDLERAKICDAIADDIERAAKPGPCPHGVRWPWACDDCDQAALRATTPATAGAGAIALDRQAIIDVVMRETTDKIVADGWEKLGAPNVLVQGCRYVRGPHGRGYEDPEDAGRKFAGFIADAILARAGAIAGAREPHKIMTAEEYASRPLKGWHEVCRDWDGLGGTAIRYLGEAPPAQPAGDRIAELVSNEREARIIAAMQKRTDALCESNYLAGMKCGWNLGMSEDVDRFKAVQDGREGYLALLKEARAELDALAPPGGGSREEVAALIRSAMSEADEMTARQAAGKRLNQSDAERMRGFVRRLVLALRPSVPQAAEGDETPASIAAWQEATFGPPASNASYAVRALRELSELIQWLVDDDNHPEAGPEFADILICLSGAAHRMNLDLRSEVNRKMAINRARKWRMTGPGHGQHIPTDAQSGEEGHVRG